LTLLGCSLKSWPELVEGESQKVGLGSNFEKDQVSISCAKMCLAQIHADCLSSSHILFASFQRLDQLNAILLEQKQTSDSWFNVTCTWLKNNQDTWSNWIPDASQCFAGFGLYDETMQEFTNTRNTSNKIVCKASPGISWVTLNWAEK